MSELFVWKDAEGKTVVIRQPTIYRALCEIAVRFGCPLHKDIGDTMLDFIISEFFAPSEANIPWSRQNNEA